MVAKGRGKWELSSGCKVSVGEDEKVLEMGVGDGHTTVRMNLAPLNYTLKNG